MFQAIITIIAVIFVIVYLKNLSKDLRDKQVKLATESAGVGITAAVYVAKRAVQTVANAGKVAAMTVEANHKDAINSASDSMAEYIKNNGGTVKQTGLTLGKKVTDVTYIDDMDNYLKDQISKLS